MLPQKLLFVVLLSASSVACGQSVVDQAENDELYMVADGDEDMEAAFRSAKSGLDGFLATWRSPPQGASDFSVKVGVTDGDDTEYFWVSPFREASGSFSGTLNNEPQLVSSVRLGQEISFSRGQIVDWLYFDQGTMVGNYTACAMLKKESQAERDAFEERFGLRCGA